MCTDVEAERRRCSTPDSWNARDFVRHLHTQELTSAPAAAARVVTVLQCLQLLAQQLSSQGWIGTPPTHPFAHRPIPASLLVRMADLSSPSEDRPVGPRRPRQTGHGISL